jgi:hypothetical protein
MTGKEKEKRRRTYVYVRAEKKEREWWTYDDGDDYVTLTTYQSLFNIVLS